MQFINIQVTEEILGEAISFTTEPSLETVIVRPRGNDNSFFLNHFRIRQFCAIFMISPPSPKIERPASIKLIFLLWHPNANKNCPTNRISPTTTNTLFGPYLQMKSPPMKGSMIFGKE